MKDGKLHMDHITCGMCYYPEHWSPGMWEDDIRRMRDAGIEVIRIAEFAWNKFEPEEGRYTFEFFDEFLSVAEKYGMKIIMCTPTATPPLWLSEKYPEILNVDIDGNRIYHGTRRHNNLNSPVYRDYSRRITEQLAKHYVAHPLVIGWQLDNEINCENDVYYSSSDHEAFREYCKEKYKTLDNFNEQMGTVFWNQTYTDWNQVHLTRRTNTYGHTNPHLQLEEKRFISYSACSFFANQAEIIRQEQKRCGREDQFITTNGIFRHIEYQEMLGDTLDFITFDNYPAFAFENILVPDKTNGLKDRNSSHVLSRVRSISPLFGIMEQQTGAGGWNCRMKMPMPKPGKLRLWTMQAIAHGADYIGYFRWRTAHFGTEIYWHGVLDYDNRDNRRLRELSQTTKDVAAMSEVAGCEYEAKTAILYDYGSEWDGEADIWHGEMRGKSVDAWFCALQKAHIPFDFVRMTDELDAQTLKKYNYIIYPHATIFTKERMEILQEAVSDGAQVVFGCRSGYKDLTGKCTPMPMPGHIAELTGCTVEEYTTVSSFDMSVSICAKELSEEENRTPAIEFHDILEVTDGEVMGTFEGEGCHYAGKPAIVRKTNGTGAGWYVGAGFDESLAKLFIRLLDMEKVAPYCSYVQVPEEVEIALRKKDEKEFLFLLNYEDAPKKIHIDGKENYVFREVLTGDVCEGDIYIAANDICLLKIIKKEG